MFGIFWEINSTSQSFRISTWLSLKLLLTMWKITLYSSCKDPIFNKYNICLVCMGISFDFFWSNFLSKHVTKWFYYIICFLFYKQPQTEIDKNSRKCWTTPWGWIFTVWILFSFFINVIIQKMIRHILKK